MNNELLAGLTGAAGDISDDASVRAQLAYIEGFVTRHSDFLHSWSKPQLKPARRSRLTVPPWC